MSLGSLAGTSQAIVMGRRLLPVYQGVCVWKWLKRVVLYVQKQKAG